MKKNIIRKLIYFYNYLIDKKKILIINYIVFVSIVFILLLIDQVSKSQLYDETKYGEVIHQNWLFGIRSIKNQGLTFASWLESKVALITFFNIIILLVCFFIVIYFDSFVPVIFVAFIFSGSLGNTIDRLSFGYVKDILFIPWFDKGTFNFADLDVMIGSICLVIILIINFLKERKI